MSIMPFNEMMARARKGQYAVGYFESWNMESLLAVADAAEALRSPVILGFSGICLPDPRRSVTDTLGDYAALGLEVCRRLSVPACLLFNESADMNCLLEALELGFHLVMFTDEKLGLDEQVESVRRLVQAAHVKSVAVEGEITPLAGAGGEAVALDRPHLTDTQQAGQFVERTGVDAAVTRGSVPDPRPLIVTPYLNTVVTAVSSLPAENNLVESAVTAEIDDHVAEVTVER